MKHSFKKLTAWLCCMAMLISFIPATALPVFAADTTVTYTEDTDGVLTADDFAATGAVKLTAATTASATIKVTKGTDLYLDLNGQSLTLDTVATLFDIEGGSVTVTDLTGTTGADWTEATGGAGVITRAAGVTVKNDGLIYVHGGTFNLEAGTISGVDNSGAMSGISRTYTGTFNINGGKITGNKASYGGAIFIGQNAANDVATVNMTNGIITGNSAAVTGGAIHVGKGGTNTFNMTGGEISNNTAGTNGGGVCVVKDGTGKFVIDGDAVIKNNTAKLGGGVYVEGTGVVDVLGGEISGNTSSGYGGGVHALETSTVNISGGTITKNVGTRGNNVCMGEGNASTLNITGGTVTKDTSGDAGYEGIYSHTGDVTVSGGNIEQIYWRGGTVTVSGGEIGVFNTGNVGSGTEGPVIKITGNPVCPNFSVHSTVVTATIGELTEGADLYFSSKGVLAITDGTVAVATDGRTYTYQVPTLPVSGTVLTGEYVMEADLTLSSSLSIAAGSDVVIDLNGHTIDTVADKEFTLFSIAAGATLTINDSAEGGTIRAKEAPNGSPAFNLLGELVLNGGTVTGWTRNGVGALINMNADSTFKMTGGKITGNSAASYTVIRPFGAGHTVEITGGEITGNESGSFIIAVTGTAENFASLTIGGDAVVGGNTKNGAAFAKEEIAGTAYTNITVGDEADVGALYLGSVAAEGVTDYGSITVTGAPAVDNITVSTTGRTPIIIKELTEGAAVKSTAALSLKDGAIDETVVRTGPDAEDGNKYTYAYKVPTYAVTTPTVAGGKVTVEPAEGAAGTTVTVTATPDEGFALVEILVNGKAIQGDTFQIVAGDNVVTATFEATDAPLPTSGSVASCEYVLKADHVLTGGLTVKDGAEVVIDLAGKTISMLSSVDATYFNVMADSKLTVKDSVGGGKIQFKNTAGGAAGINVYGEFVLEGGELTGWTRVNPNKEDPTKTDYGAGGMVFVQSTGKVTIAGGKLTNAECGYGAAIRMNAAGGEVTMTGGEISGNKSSKSGYGPIYMAAGTKFTMSGGTIKDNVGYNGGVFGMNGAAEVVISGGEITGNEATKNGGVVYNMGTVAITGGTITGNKVSGTGDGDQGGAVWIGKGSTTTITGGTITGNSAMRGGAIGTGEITTTESLPVLTIGGTAVIKDNVCTQYGGNIYAYTTNVTIEGGTIGSAFKGEAVANKSSSGNIWLRGNDVTVTTITGGTIEGLTVTAGTTTVSGNPVIAEINAAMTVSNLTSGAKFRTAGVGMVTVPEGDDTVYTTNDRDYLCKQDMGFGDKFVPGATVTLTEETSAGAGVTLSAAGEYVLDLNGFTLTGNAAPYITVGAGAKLTIKDSSEAKTGKIVGIKADNQAMIQVNGEFVLEGGLLTGHTNTHATDGAFGAVRLGVDAVMTMSGGEISGNTARRGAGVSTGDAQSNATFTMNGGFIGDNVLTGSGYMGANLYFFSPAMVTITGDAKLGTAYVQDAEGNRTLVTTNTACGAMIRSGNAVISGGDIKLLNLSNIGGEKKDESGALITEPSAVLTGVKATVTGSPVIALLGTSGTAYATVKELTSGAYIETDTQNNYNSTDTALTVLDNTVSVQGKVYQCADDLTSILFVANSFGGDTTSYLPELGRYFGKGMDAAYMYIGSQSIRWHAQSLAESLRETDLNGDGVIGDSRDKTGSEGLYGVGNEKDLTFPDVLDSGKKWDYVVLQPGVQYVGYEGTYNSDMDFLIDYIEAVQPDAKILWSQTWAMDERQWSNQANPDKPDEVAAGGYWQDFSGYLTQFGGSQEAMYDAILRNTEKFIAGDDARFAADLDGWFPIGIAVQTMRDSYSDTYLTRDGFHLSRNAGCMIAGLTVMKTLFGDEIDLSKLTAEDIAGMFKDTTLTNSSTTDDHLGDLFDPTEENVAKLIAAVEAACGYKTTVPAYGDGTANKQFNPDAAGDYVAVYEGVTEVGNLGTGDNYATAGAGKIVVYKGETVVGTIDELWLEENAGIVLTDRYNKIANGEEYYIIADAQAPQLAVVGSKLYLTFDVKLYSDTQNTIINGGVYMTSFDGTAWSKAVKVSEAPMAYGLTALSDGNLIMSVTDTSTKVLKLDASGTVTGTVELCADVADVAFAEVGANVYALASTGALYVSADKGATWTATTVANGATNSPDLVVMKDTKNAVYATWANEAECKIYSKVWTIDTAADDYAWNNIEATAVAEYTPATAYNGKTTGGQPTTFLSAEAAYTAAAKTIYATGNELEDTMHSILTSVSHSLALESSLTVSFMLRKIEMDQLGAASVKIIESNPDAGKAPTVETYALDTTFRSGGVDYYQIAVGRAAKEMGDTLIAIAYDAGGNQVSFEDKYSVKTYIDSQMAKVASAKEGTQDAAKRTLFVDLLNYGAAAQTFFEYAENALVNSHLTAEQQAWASPALVLDETLNYNDPVNTTNGITSGKSLSAESVVEVYLNYLATTVSGAAYAKVSYVTHDGRKVDNVRYELSDYRTGGKDYKQIKIDTMATADVSTKILCDLYDTNDTFMEGSHIEYSIETFCYNQVKNGKAVAPVCMALVQAGKAMYTWSHWGK